MWIYVNPKAVFKYPGEASSGMVHWTDLNTEPPVEESKEQ